MVFVVGDVLSFFRFLEVFVLGFFVFLRRFLSLFIFFGMGEVAVLEVVDGVVDGK